MTVNFGFADCTFVLFGAHSGIFCTNPHAHCASMFDQLISIRNPVFRSQNLNDNAADAKSRSPALSANRIYAFWEAVGGKIAALKS